MIKFYIITITLNDLMGLRKTIQSVHDADIQCDYLHIIKNGVINDTASQYVRNIQKSDERLFLIEQLDQGIYDAMNQALLYVPSNSYFLYLNSGDALNGSITLGNDILYLIPAQLIDENLQAEVSSTQSLIRIKQTFFNGMPFCHQSLIIRKSPDMCFNRYYRISGDYDFVLRCVRPLVASPRQIQLVQTALISYDANGISSRRPVLRDFEGLICILKTCGVAAAISYLLFRLTSLAGKILLLIAARWTG